MASWKILTFVFATFLFVEAKQFHQKRETKPSICDQVFNKTSKIQCYCIKSTHKTNHVRSADCYPTVDEVEPYDRSWDSFDELNEATKLILTNTRGIPIKYVPTNALKHTKELRKLDIKYGNIETIQAFAFANLSVLEEIFVTGNEIRVLKAHAFAHHPNLKSINLDTNKIVEINRDVFIDLPSLEKLFLTNNKITTIHDKAFVHLENLKELEINRNNIFSLNSDSFSGLRNLDRLDLSSNSLEVIGDNTFLPLIRLRVLNLDGNKVQMIDEKGFHGLHNLQVLSLAQNALKNLDNVKVFEGLTALTSLSLKGNQLQELKKEVIAPILNNFYGPTSSLDVEDMSFPCDCRLEWFVALMNQTSSSHLKQVLENLKCIPDPELRERYNNSAPMFEDEQEETQKTADEAPAPDYEYYDNSNLDGKLFYTDLKFLLNCSGNIHLEHKKSLTTTTVKPISNINGVAVTTKEPASVRITTVQSIRVNNQGLLDLSVEDSTKTERTQAIDLKYSPENQERLDKKPTLYTTSRLATVSAKPLQNKYEEHAMASDEAKPDQIKAHRSIQEEETGSNVGSGANKNIDYVAMLLVVILLRFY